MKNKDKNKKLVGKAAAIGAVGSAVFFALGWPFFHFIAYAGKKKNGDRKKNRKKWFSLKHTVINHPKHEYLEEYEAAKAWCEEQDYHEWYIKSRDNLKLHASFLPAEKPERIVVICHGYKGTRFGCSAHLTEYLHENNCSILLIDQRCCGESEGKYVTFGAKECYDIIDWLRRLEEDNVEHLPVYLYGKSMGATSVLLAAGKICEADPGRDAVGCENIFHDLKGVIADCGFHSMKQQLRDMASGWFHLHWIELLLFRVDIFCRLLAGFSMKETDTTRALKNMKVPVLFFHGETDTYVKPENSLVNYKLCASDKELILIPGVRHLCCSYAAKEFYESKLDEFFAKTK